MTGVRGTIIAVDALIASRTLSAIDWAVCAGLTRLAGAATDGTPMVKLATIVALLSAVIVNV